MSGRPRAGVILLRDGAVALIERHRAGKHYYVIPGGGVEAGESPAAAAAREAAEELGVAVAIGCLVAAGAIDDGLAPAGEHRYFLATIVGGIFGAGRGDEMTGRKPPERGTYRPVWLPIADLERAIVWPTAVARLIVAAHEGGWPCEVARLGGDAG